VTGTGDAVQGARDAAMPLAPDRRRLLMAVRVTFVVALIAACVATPGFFSVPNILSLLTTMSFMGCVAVGMTLITISGNIMSFSLGATAGAAAMVFIVALNIGGVAIGLVAALAVAGLVSAAQGFAAGWVRANPIIVSIATSALIYGVAEIFAEHSSVYIKPGTGYEILRGKLGGVPLEFVVFLCVTAAGQFILYLTRFGRNLYMIGSSFRAAEAAGVKTWRTVTGAYLWAGLFTGLAGVMLAIRYDGANMDYGAGYDYDAIAAVLVGGTLIKGGQGSALRTFAGAMIIAIVQALLLLLGFRQEWQYLITGLIVLAVIILHTSGDRR
jgi:ribose/xylose/arabinose/galactoside ABC-type transport system permease subunit